MAGPSAGGAGAPGGPGFPAVFHRGKPRPDAGRRLDAPAGADDRLARAAEFIADNCTRPLSLGDICAAAGLSESYLIRAFQRRYGLTPHAFLIDRRIRYSRARLRRGHAIAEVAADAGFADQAHLHRAFKRLVAATPGQYRAPA